MKNDVKYVVRPRKQGPKASLDFLSRQEGEKAHKFHASFPVYKPTPLAKLKELAKTLGVKDIFVKDESHRFGLNAFKVLGGSYAIGRYIAAKLGEDIENMPSEKMLSPQVREKLGELTFVTATDGNHGRGVAWTANQLGQNSVVYMPLGSAPERLENIRAEGAQADIVDMNYDEAVRLANSKAESEGWIMVQDTAWEGYTEIPTWIIQGYSTMACEIIQQLEEMGEEKPSHIFLQAGVGSMAAAMQGFFAAEYGENRPFVGVVEPNKADCVFRTAEANDGELHFVAGRMDTIMAGLACGEPCTIGWDILNDYSDAFISCPDYMAADGMRILAAPKPGDSPVVSGESGAAPLGCIANVLTRNDLKELKEQLKLNENSRILFISTEGDTDKETYRKIVWGGRFNKFCSEEE